MGTYIYCITEGAEGEHFGPLGIGDRGDELTSITYRDIGAVVSDSPVMRYPVSRENSLAHERAIEAVFKRHTVLPARFCTIAEDDAKVRAILEREYDELRALLKEMRDKAEVGVKAVFLVVDDEPERREILAEYLQGKGFEVLQAAGGEEALRRFPGFRPQVVLLDVMMAGISGVDTLKRIKALPQETCVVMVSGLEDVETARRTLTLGAAGYIAKPVDFAYLDSVLEAHMLMAHLDASR